MGTGTLSHAGPRCLNGFNTPLAYRIESPPVDHPAFPLRMRPLHVTLIATFLLGLAPFNGSFAQTQKGVPVGVDTTRTTGESLDLGLRVYPLAFWGPQSGVGLGAGLSLKHLGWDGSQLLATALPAAHRGVYTLGFATADPYTTPLYGLLDLRVEANGRQWYYGIGPATSADHQIAVDLQSAHARLRLGGYIVPQTVLLQPHVGIAYHFTRSFRNVDDGAVDALDPASRAALLSGAGRLSGTGDRQTGFTYGFDAVIDTRDLHDRPHRGVMLQARFERYTELRDADLQFNQYEANVSGYLPLAPHHTIALRAQGAVTDAEGTVPIPFYLVPRLDGRAVPGLRRERFFGNDLVLLGASYQFPLHRWLDLFKVEGRVGLDVASVYNDVFDEFEASISFDETLSAPRAQYPLRPAASLGLRLMPLFRDEVYVDVAVGISAEGVTAVRFRFTPSFRALRPES